MANDYALELSPDLDPETAAELRKLRRQQQMADEMYKRGMQPMQGQMVGGVYVRPSITQGLSNMANAYMSGQEQNRIDEGYKALGDKRKAVELAASEALKRGTMGTPESMTGQAYPAGGNPDEQGGMGFSPAVTPTPEQRRNAIMEAMMGESPRVSKKAEMMFKIDESNAARKAALEQRMHELQLKMEDSRVAREDRLAAQKELMQMRLEGQKELKSMGSAIAGAQPVTPVTIQDPENPNSTIIIDGRTKQVLGKGPKLTETGKLENKRQFNMQGLGQTLQEAEDLLTGATGKPLPTGSGIGTVYDAAAGLVGASPEGAKEAQQLKAVGGALTSKMPRMEGPQSDKDTALYKEMAAVVGDSTVPRERRLAALRTVKSLWEKYETGQQPSSSGSSGGWGIRKLP